MKELFGQSEISSPTQIISDGGSAGQCEMPNTMLVEDMSGDGSGSTSILTRTETQGPCICSGKTKYFDTRAC